MHAVSYSYKVRYQSMVESHIIDCSRETYRYFHSSRRYSWLNRSDLDEYLSGSANSTTSL